MTRYLQRKRKAASERGRRMAKSRWDKDREFRRKLAEMEFDRRRRFVVTLRNKDTGEEWVLPWDSDTLCMLRALVEKDSDL